MLRIGFSPKTSGRLGLIGMMQMDQTLAVLQILENIHSVVIAVAGADDGETVCLEEGSQRSVSGQENLRGKSLV